MVGRKVDGMKIDEEKQSKNDYSVSFNYHGKEHGKKHFKSLDLLKNCGDEVKREQALTVAESWLTYNNLLVEGGVIRDVCLYDKDGNILFCE